MKKLWMMSAIALFLAVPAAMAEHHEGGKGGAMMDKKFAQSDLDGNGEISKEEFLKEAEGRFSKIDADGNGSVTKEEMQKHKMEKRGKWKEMKENKEKGQEAPAE